MLPVLQIGPFAVPTPALLLLIGLWAAMTAGARYTLRFNIESKKIDDLILLTILAGLIGAKVFYVMRFPKVFIANPAGMLSLNPSLFDFSAGFLVAGIAFLVIMQRKKLPIWSTLDALVIPLSVMWIFVGLSHFASGAVYGTPTALPWAIRLWGAERHPTQLYETLLALSVFLVMMRSLNRKEVENQPKALAGAIFLRFCILLSLVWIFLETFRADTLILIGNLRTVQVISLLVLGTSFWFQDKLRKNSEAEEREENVSGA